jgi:hypothetical protein
LGYGGQSSSFWLWRTAGREGGEEGAIIARAPELGWGQWQQGGGARVCHPGGRHRKGGRARRGTGGAPEAAAIWLDERNT